MKISKPVKKVGSFITDHFDSVSDAVSRIIESIKGTPSEDKSPNDSKDKNVETGEEIHTSESTSLESSTEKAVDEETDFFEESADDLIAAFKDTLTGKDPMAMFSALNHVTNETIQYCAQQETEQVEIKARRDVAVSKIKATTDIISKYLDKSFDERSSEFNHYFTALDKAMETNDVDMLRSILLSINTLANSSPFKNISLSEVGEALKSPETEWDI